MHRQQLIQKLNHYRLLFVDEQKKIDDILTFIDTNKNCFDRELSVGHITASSWLENHDGELALLGLHKKLGIWVQLGGHADGDSNTLAVAVREAQEESGIQEIEPVSEEIFDVDIHLIPARLNEPEHFHYDIRYHLRVTRDVEYRVNDELHGLKWMSVQGVYDLPKPNDSLIRMAEKWKVSSQSKSY